MVRDHEELRRLRHLEAKARQSRLVRFVERRVHFVKQAEGRGIEFEHGKNKRRGGERLLAPGERSNGGVFLPRRLRRDVDPRGEDFVTGHRKFGVPAPEKPREGLFEVSVHALEGLPHAASRIRVDRTNGGFQRVRGRTEVFDLKARRFENFFRFFKLQQGRMVDGPERGDFARQARDFVSDGADFDAARLRDHRHARPVSAHFVHALRILLEQSLLFAFGKLQGAL